MENKFEEQFLELEDTIFEDVDFGNLSSIIPRLEMLKELADKSGVWEHRVSSRRKLIKFSYELDFLEKMMGELIWLVGMWETNKEDAELEEGMVLLERFIEYLPAFPNVEKSDIHQAIKILEAWFATTSREPHYLAWSLYKTYSKLGDKASAKKYKEQLLNLEKVEPFRFSSSPTTCASCTLSIKIHYYASIGLLDKAMILAEPLLEDDVSFCMTSPRTGLSYLLDAFMDADRISEISVIIPTLVLHIDEPSKAPLRIANPLLRYYLETKNISDVQRLIEDYTPVAEKLADRLTVDRFFKLAGSADLATKK